MSSQHGRDAAQRPRHLREPHRPSTGLGDGVAMIHASHTLKRQLTIIRLLWLYFEMDSWLCDLMGCERRVQSWAAEMRAQCVKMEMKEYRR